MDVGVRNAASCVLLCVTTEATVEESMSQTGQVVFYLLSRCHKLSKLCSIFLAGVTNRASCVLVFLVDVTNRESCVLTFFVGVTNRARCILVFLIGVTNRASCVLVFLVGVTNRARCVLVFLVGVTNRESCVLVLILSRCHKQGKFCSSLPLNLLKQKSVS